MFIESRFRWQRGEDAGLFITKTNLTPFRRVCALDLDPKSASKIPKYHKLDQAIVKNYLALATK